MYYNCLVNSVLLPDNQLQHINVSHVKYEVEMYMV